MTNTVLAGQTLTDGLLGIPVWSPMSLQNSWSNAGGSYVTAQYRLWELINEVEIIGRIAGGTISPAPSSPPCRTPPRRCRNCRC